MIPFRVFLAAMLALTIGALLFRSIDAGNRPMHGDEAVHAEKFRDLWEKGVYQYDANEYHGPTIYYAALPSVKLSGRHSWPETREADYRLPIAVLGAAMILALLPLAAGLGRKATLVASVLTAVSPAFVFYSRYFIQEVPLVLFTLCLIASGWRYCQTRSMKWLALAGTSAGLMIATKETAVLTFFSIAVAAGLTSVYTAKMDGRKLDLKAVITPRVAAVAVIITLIVASAFLSGFGTNMHGPLDYLKAYTPWLRRAHGTDIHRHPFFYYLEILVWTHKQHGGVWSELLIVGLAAVGLVAALTAKQEKLTECSAVLWRFIAIYTVVLTYIYSAIPYKTPWCVLSFLSGMILLAGLGGVVILSQVPGASLKVVAAAVLLAGTVQLGNQAYRASWKNNADPHNPYVYAATSADVVNLEKRIDDLAKSWPEHNQMIIKVFSTSNYYWPLPWYLRRYPNVGYYSRAPITKDEAEAAVTLCAPELDEPMTAMLTDDLMNGMNEVRPGVFFEVFIRMDVWTAFLNSQNRGVVKKFVPPPPAD